MSKNLVDCDICKERHPMWTIKGHETKFGWWPFLSDPVDPIDLRGPGHTVCPGSHVVVDRQTKKEINDELSLHKSITIGSVIAVIGIIIMELSKK